MSGARHKDLTISANIKSNDNLTMSSREIADICATRHNQIVETIERLFRKGVLRESRKTTRNYSPPDGGRPTKVYDLTKTDTLKVVSGYDEELRGRVIDRWMELEEQVRDGATSNDNELQSIKEKRLQFNHYLRLGKLAGLEGAQLLISANKATKTSCGFDTLAIMGISLTAPIQEQLVTPTWLGEQLDMTGRQINKILTQHGYHLEVRAKKNRVTYQPTEKGKQAGGTLDVVGRSHSDGSARQLKWPVGMSETLKDLIGEGA